MALSIVTFLIAILSMVLLIVFKPTLRIGRFSIQTFWIPPLLASFFVFATSQVGFPLFWEKLTTGAMNPLKILVLFLSLSSISISLDELHFFSFLSHKALEKAGSSQYRIFFALYALVSFLTVFTSNDIVILTFTPFIIHFCKKGKIDPLPYLLCEFVNANTYSMLLSIGNPTNIYLSSCQGIGFLPYLTKMWLPTLLSGLLTLGLLLLLFHKRLAKKITPVDIKEEKLGNKGLVAMNLASLLLSMAVLILANYIDFPSWLVLLLLSFLCLALTFAFTRSKAYLLDVAKRIPWNLVPFVLSMFVLVLSLQESKALSYFAEALEAMSVNETAEGFVYSISSTLAANLINNIPMSILYSNVLAGKSDLAVYASIVGSNVGAYLTPIGALAGIMWMGILKKHEVDFSFLSFMKYGLLLAPCALLGATCGLLLLC